MAAILDQALNVILSEAGSSIDDEAPSAAVVTVGYARAGDTAASPPPGCGSAAAGTWP